MHNAVEWVVVAGDGGLVSGDGGDSFIACACGRLVSCFTVSGCCWRAGGGMLLRLLLVVVVTCSSFLYDVFQFVEEYINTSEVADTASQERINVG